MLDQVFPPECHLVVQRAIAMLKFAPLADECERATRHVGVVRASDKAPIDRALRLHLGR